MADLLFPANLSQQTNFILRVQSAIVSAAVSIANETANDVQTLTITGGPTGGTFTLTYSGQTTAAIAFNASAVTVQLALEALSNVAPGDVVCTGGALPSTGIVITFTGTLGSTAQPVMTFANSLTGGTTPTPVITHTTTGVAFVNHTARRALASKVLANPSGYAVLFAPTVATSSTVQADYSAGTFALNGVSESTAGTDIQNQVNSVWDAMS